MRQLSIIFLFFGSCCFAQCPLKFIKVDPVDNTSGRYVVHSFGKGKNAPPEFVVRVENISGKDIRGLKIQAAYFDATEDLSQVPLAWNWSSIIKAGATTNMVWPNEIYRDTAVIGWVVVPIKILFEDGSAWNAFDSTPGCFGEYWRNKKHPRLTAVPMEIVKKSKSADGETKP